MKKSDLKTGMVVQTRDGRNYLVVTGDSIPVEGGYPNQTLVFISNEGWDCGDDFTEDLKNILVNNRDLDIVKVYQSRICSFSLMFSEEELKESILLWERKD